MSNRRIATTIAAVALAVVLMIGGITWAVAGTWSKTDAAEMSCVYNGGPMDNSSFKAYAEPGNGRQYQGWMSDVIDVPTVVRQFRISLNPDQGDTPAPDSVSARVKGYAMRFEPTIAFTINTAVNDEGVPMSCDFIINQLRQFGDPDFNSAGGGWSDWLNERLRPLLDDSMTRVLQSGYDPGDLKFNTNGERDKAADEIAEDLQRKITEQFGDDFLCSPSTAPFSDDCGTIEIILPAPSLSDEDEAQLAKPQRARIDADNDIAAADETARKASEVADAKEVEADSAERRATAEQKIATENGRVLEANAVNDYAWCEYLVVLGQDCALVAAAENNDFPDVFTPNGVDIAIPVGG